jgi:hypothetical protein
MQIRWVSEKLIKKRKDKREYGQGHVRGEKLARRDFAKFSKFRADDHLKIDDFSPGKRRFRVKCM